MNCAKKVTIFGHTFSGMGEKSLSLKFKRAFEQAGYYVDPIIDIIDFMGVDYEPFAQINYDLADAHFSLIEDLKELTFSPSDLQLILSWGFSLAALFGAGIHKKAPTAAKLYVHHPNERILTKLYEPADVLITESLLANEKALEYGIDPAKVLYVPHTYPAECTHISPSREYAERLAKNQGKSISPHAKIIGCVGRLEYGKNCEFAIEAVRRLVEQKQDLVLILKGDFPEISPYPDYKPLFSDMLRCYESEPWLLWDKSFTPYPQVLKEYSSFDLLVHPSGAEGGSHVVVECLGLKMPVILLDCSTNPYLFKGLATFVRTTKKIRPALLPFYIPDIDELCKTLESELKPPNNTLVEERFHEALMQERMHLLFDRDPKKIVEQYIHDRKRHGI